jgi:hypothetical protein
MTKNRMFAELREYFILEKDVKEVFEFIEPDGDKNNDNRCNLDTYSYRLAGLLLRNCIAVESHLKKILKEDISNRKIMRPSRYKYDKGHSKRKRVNINEKEWNMRDYYKIEKNSAFSRHVIKISSWRSKDNEIRPFELWGGSGFKALPWYTAYNKVKHYVQGQLKEATVKNVRDSLAGLFVLLYVRYELKIFDPYQEFEGPWNETSDGYFFATGSLFAIKRLS